jgi:hypothetical protein
MFLNRAPIVLKIPLLWRPEQRLVPPFSLAWLAADKNSKIGLCLDMGEGGLFWGYGICLSANGILRRALRAQIQDTFIPLHAWSKLVLVIFHPLSKVKETFL